MKIFNKYLFIALLGGLTLTSCSDDDDYTAGTIPTSGENVYFSGDNSVNVALGLEDSQITVTVERESGAKAASVPLTAGTGNEGIFTVPSTVEFAAGETSKEITITVSDAMETFKSYFLSLTIDENYTDPYKENAAPSKWALSIIKEDYQPYAEGTYVCEFFGDSWPMTLEYSPMTDQYRFSDLWESGYDVTFTWDGSESVVVNGGNAVATGYVDSRYGMVSANPVECYYDTASQTFIFGYKWVVSAGSFGEYPDAFTVTSLY